MFQSAPSIIEKRLQNLESHLQHENPVLLSAVKGFREIDRVARKLGLLTPEESYATMIPWWPLISVLGTYSSGKSTFINHYLQYPLQTSGNQAVDDKFTVICQSREDDTHVLPGLALDGDPRFPFYQISEEIEKVAQGEGRRIDAYLQLKTCPSEQLAGKILIDSPGFDADAQRTSTLRITEHIVNLSDLVLVFFDARHPEPGAMHDTLEHLVEKAIVRPDSSKFLYILNQIDTAAREDNPEEVFGAWQRALAQKGLTAGRFYTIYNPDAAVPIEDDSLRRRFEQKRDQDLGEIHGRINEVKVERAYRIVGALEKMARGFEERLVPLLSEGLTRWRRSTLLLDGIVLGMVAGLGIYTSRSAGYWEGGVLSRLEALTADVNATLAAVAFLMVVGGYVHYQLRGFAARRVIRWLAGKAESPQERAGLVHAFRKSTRPWRSLFSTQPAGWGRRAKKRLGRVIADTDRFVQILNDRYTNPAGTEPALPKRPLPDPVVPIVENPNPQGV